jgi:hypothetical protein
MPVPAAIIAFFLSFFFSFGVLQLTLLEAPQPYGLLYYTRNGNTNFLFTSSALPRPLRRENWGL